MSYANFGATQHKKKNQIQYSHYFTKVTIIYHQGFVNPTSGSEENL